MLLKRAVDALSEILSLIAINLSGALRPRQLGADREEKVIKAVGDDCIVVEADEGVDDYSRISQALIKHDALSYLDKVNDFR